MLEIGSSLREARRRRGVGLPEAEAATMIRARYLDALETERFELLPEGPYLRSFLREYSEYLGLDGDIFVTEYMLRFPPPAPEPETLPRRGVATVLADLPRGPILVVAALVVVVAIGAWQLEKNGPTVGKPPSTPAAHAVVQSHRPRAAPTHSAVTRTAARTAAATSLELTAARGSCWVQVRLGSATGRVLVERTLQPGETERLGLRKSLWIRLGAPWNVDATLGTRSVTTSLPAKTGNVLATGRGLTAA